MSLGYSQNDFWRLTPKQLTICFKAASIRLLRERDERTYQTWLGGVLEHGQKNYPKLETLLSTHKPKPQTQDQMLAIVKAMNAAMGGDFIEKKGD